MIEPYKHKAAIGAKKATGQIKKVAQLINEGAYCMDIIQQIRAVEGLLTSLSANVLESHLHTCAKKAFSTKDNKTQEKVIKELVHTFKVSKK